MSSRLKSVAVGTFTVALLGVVAAAQSQTVKPPGPGPIRPFVFPHVEQFQLANGLKVIVVEKHALPVVEGRLIVDAGAMREPAAKNGLAFLTGALLREGTTGMSGAQIADRMAELGAQFNTGGAFANAFADIVALKNVFPQALKLAGQTIQAPTFPESDFGRVKNQALASYRQRLAQASGLASDAFVRAAFDTTAPFSRPAGGTTATLTGLTRDDVINWHRSMYAPAGSTLLLVGDLTPAEARSIAQDAFGSWSSTRASVGPISNPVRKFSGVRIILVDRPGSVQSSMLVGQPGFQATDPDYLPLVAVNHILGGQASSRLNINLREKHGYTYGAFSGFDLRPGAGVIRMGSEVRTNATDSALVEAVNEYRRVVNEPVPAPEFQSAVNNLVNAFPNTVQSVQDLTNRLQNLIVWGLPVDYYATYRERLSALTPEDAARVAKARFTPDNLLVVIAGDLSKIEAPIRARNLGSVEVWDAAGNKVR